MISYHDPPRINFNSIFEEKEYESDTAADGCEADASSSGYTIYNGVKVRR